MPTDPRRLTDRATAALAFIAIQNMHGAFPNTDVRRFLVLKHKRQGTRVVEELIRAQFIRRTWRGLRVMEG